MLIEIKPGYIVDHTHILWARVEIGHTRKVHVKLRGSLQLTPAMEINDEDGQLWSAIVRASIYDKHFAMTGDPAHVS